MARLTPIRLALLQENRTQAWLAEQVGVSRPEISRVVNGYVPGDDVIENVCRVLGRDMSVLFPHLSPASDHTSAAADPSQLEAA